MTNHIPHFYMNSAQLAASAGSLITITEPIVTSHIPHFYMNSAQLAASAGSLITMHYGADRDHEHN
ncbi:MAG TPA: hypothetical protein V6D17_16820 [Candidatus Obscuribacterales bacterium]